VRSFSRAAATATPARRAIIERASLVVVGIASAWFAFTAVWGMFGIPGGGHLGAGSISSIVPAEHILRWKIAYPTWDWYGTTRPPKTSFPCHHPFGTFYLPLPILALFGHHDFVVRLPGALFWAPLPPLLYGIAKERWGAAIGAVAAASYVVVPIAVGYSNWWGLETVVIFGALLFFWGHSRHVATRKSRYLTASVVGAAIACSGDWPGYIIVATLLAWSFVRAFVLPRWLTPRFPREAYARWWALSVAVLAGTLLLWLCLFYRANQLGDWLSAGAMRSGGNELPLKVVLESRKDWIDFSFTPLAILVGKIAAPVCLLRLLLLRRDEEAYSLALLLGAVIQYVEFKQGADVHIFWPLYFAPYFALAHAQLIRTVASAGGWVARRFVTWRAARATARPGHPRWHSTVAAGGIATLAVGLIAPLAMAHDAVRSLAVWRGTGGRYDDHGSRIRSQIDLLAVLEQVVVPRNGAAPRIDAHPGVEWYWDAIWTIRGQANTTAAPVTGAPSDSTHPFWFARASGMSSDEQRRIARSAYVQVFGDTWVVDQRKPPAPLDAYSLNEREPNPIEWLFLGGTEPVRTAGAQPDPWLTWEWRTHLGLEAPAPTGEPRSLDEMRIAHNVAVSRGDQAGARAWRDRIEAQLDRTRQASFQNLQLVGVRVVGGVQPRIESWFEPSAAPTGDATFAVRSTLEARAPLSLLPVNKTDREMAYAPSLATRLWREHFLYKTVTVMNHRIGRERYLGRWVGAWAPRRSDGAPETTLAIEP
jgi:hypothetical protein